MALGPMELMVLLFWGAGGTGADLFSLISPEDYFQARKIDLSVEKLVQLAGQDPTDGKTQLAQLMALRYLGDNAGKTKAAKEYKEHRKVIDQIAQGKKAQDKLGFAREYAARTLAQLDGKKYSPGPLPGKLPDALAWFPANATLVGALEGSRSLPGAQDFHTQLHKLVLKDIPAREREQIFQFAEMVGNIRIDRVGFALIDDPNDPKNFKVFLRVTGKINHDWMIAALEKKLDNKPKRIKGSPISIIYFRLSTTAAIIGDTDFLVGITDQAEFLKQVLEAGKRPGPAQGDLKKHLEKISNQATGFLAGQIPEAIRKELKQDQLGVAPRSIRVQAVRKQSGLDASIELTLDNNQDAAVLVDRLKALKKKGLAALEELEKDGLPKGLSFAPVKKMIQGINVEAKDADVSIQAHVANEVFMAITAWFVSANEPAPPQKKVIPQKDRQSCGGGIIVQPLAAYI